MNNILPFPAPPRQAQTEQRHPGNPMQAIVSQFMGGMSPMAILDRIGGPQAQQAKSLIAGKNENQLREIATNMARQRGVDLDGLAQQLGVQIPR
jgi:hypothetical protein